MKILDIDFLIIGATKSATTWLQRSLQLDPMVYMPNPELHFFSREYERGEDWYCEQFKVPATARLVGEKSNSYLESIEAAARIHAALPSVKLIAQLRNPIERAYSDYCMLFRRGEVGREIARHLDPRSPSGSRFLGWGLYYKQLQPFLDLFPSDRLLLLLYDDMSIDPDAQVVRARNHLGLPPASSGIKVNEKVKDRDSAVLSPTLRTLFRPLKPVLAPVRETKPFKFLHALAARRTAYPPLTGELRKRLSEYFAQDVESLGRHMGRDLSAWSAEEATTSEADGAKRVLR